MKKAVIIKVYGRVQGVSFRHYTLSKANEFNITGFVKNKADGSVHIEAEGNPNDLETFVDWCRQGPGWSRITKIEKQYYDAVGYSDFVIK
jgi:acylphosphatase